MTFIYTKYIHNNKKKKFIRTDNGTSIESSNNIFQWILLTLKEFIQQFTIPYNPEMNGHAERLNGTLIAAAKSMLKRPKPFP